MANAAATSRLMSPPRPLKGVAPPPGALVLGADYRALGAVRSLGRRGVPVRVVREQAEPLACVSRYVDASFAWPEDAEERVAFLCDLAERERLHGWALIPTADETAALVARNHDVLGRHFTLTTPAWDVLRWAYDKRLTYALAERLDVECPRTVRPGDGERVAALDLSFPVVLKPAVKESFNRLTAAKAWRVDSNEELVERYAEACALVPPETLMIQELVPGGGEGQFSFAALCLDGEPLAWLTARRARQYPAEFGRASTYVETVDCAEIVDPSCRLLRWLRYTGLIELEFKRDSRDGRLKLLDMNPRLWGWHTLCTRAGVDFPYLLWLLACRRPLPATCARPGIGWLRLTTDTPTAVKELARGRLRLGDYARSWWGPRERAIFAWDDPLPGLAELPLVAYVLGTRLVRGEGV